MLYRGDDTPADPRYPYPDVQFPELFRFLPAEGRLPPKFRQNEIEPYDKALLYTGGNVLFDAQQRQKLLIKSSTYKDKTDLEKQALIIEGNIVTLEANGGRLNDDTLRRIAAQYSSVTLPNITTILATVYFQISVLYK